MDYQDSEWVRLYGAGWQFPPRFRLTPPSPSDSPLPAGAVQMSAGMDNVAQSLRILFQTQPGERIMRPAYGCDMQSAVFANMSEGVLATLYNQIAESIARYEPRVEDVDIDIQEDGKQPGTLRIAVTYRLAGQTQQLSGQLDVLEGTTSGRPSWVIS